MYPETGVRSNLSVHVFPGFLRIIKKKMCPETQVRSKLCVSVYGGELGIYLRKNLEGAELDLHFDVKIGLVLCFLLPQVL